MVSHQLLLHLGVHAPVHAPNALHQAHRIPVDVVINHARCILQVQAFGQHIRGHQHADLRQPVRCQIGGRAAVVVRRKALDHIRAAALCGAVHLRHAINAGRIQLRLQVARRVRKLCKNQHLLPGQLFGLKQPHKLLQLVIMLGLEFARLNQKLHNLVHVQK